MTLTPKKKNDGCSEAVKNWQPLKLKQSNRVQIQVWIPAVVIVEQLDQAVHPEWHSKSKNRPIGEDSFKIVKASAEINRPALLSYIHSRGLETQYFSGIAKEVHWLKDDRKFFGLGFINHGNGYAISSPMFKFNIGSNQITHVQIGNNPIGIKIFEGGFDLASFRKLFPSSSFKAIGLNGLANFTPLLMEEINFNSIRSKTKVELYLDNDPAGDEKTATATEIIKRATDGRRLYTGFQDLNDFLVSGQDRKLGEVITGFNGYADGFFLLVLFVL